jgi:hypothetical protein
MLEVDIQKVKLYTCMLCRDKRNILHYNLTFEVIHYVILVLRMADNLTAIYDPIF